MMDGTHITAMRTGAATAVGAKYLARPPLHSVSLIGAGVQSRFQLRALAKLFALEQVFVNDINRPAADRFANEMGAELGISIRVGEDMARLCGADLVIAATTAKEPVIRGKWLALGSLVVPLGSYREIDAETVQRADKIVVDSLEQATHRGSLAEFLAQHIIAPADIYAEIGQIVAGQKPGRTSNDEIIVYQPIGIGSTDVALAFRVYQRAQERKMGTPFEFL
jgi:ornithine cyclodeaminase/alanine dehydrogenase-like protein (mu-crystallin family)